MVTDMKKTIFAAVIVFLLLTLLSSAAFAEGGYKHTEYLPDGSGGFYEFSFDESGYCLYSISSSGERSSSFHGSEPMIGFNVTDGRIMLISEPKNTQPIYLSDGITHQTVVFLSGLELNGELIGADRQHRIYAVDRREPKQIIAYDSRGSRTDTISAGFAVTRIFSDADGGMWAAGRGGCISLPSGQSYKGETPKGQFTICGSYCCGSDGRVYRFSDGLFELIGKYRAPVCCTSDGEIYTADGHTLTLLGSDGNPVKALDTGVKVTALYASGKNAAYISSGELHIADKRAMQPIVTEQSSSSHQSSQVSPTPQTSEPQSSADNTPSAVSRPESSVYDLSGRFITITDGTTAAVFRDNIRFDGYSLQLFSSSGKAVSSGRLGTGTRAVFFRGRAKYEYTLILHGDLTGEGNINSRDGLALSDILIGTDDTDEITSLAADLNGDKKADLCDLLLLYRLAETGSLPLSENRGGKVGLTLTADNDINGGKAFYVYLTVSGSADTGGALMEFNYDEAKLRLTSARLSDKLSTDIFRTNEVSGKITMLLLNTSSDMSRRTVALRFEPIYNGADSYDFSARLTDAAGKDGQRLMNGNTETLRITTCEKESSKSSRSSESSSKSSKQASSKQPKESSAKASKETSSKSQSSRQTTDEKETHEPEEEDDSGITVPKVREPDDPSKRYMLIAGVAVLILAAGAGGYALARRKR